ncbi:MAG: MFS transporter [Pseudomonadota bacterium]
MTEPRLPAVSQNKYLRLFFVFITYTAQGVPVGVFFFALPGWLSANGASPLELGGFLSAASLPWSLKFINGFLMDRFAFLKMGRRRPWLITAQLIMVAGLVLLAILAPGPDELALLSGFAFVVMFATTFQDVAIDGLAVDLLEEDERGIANGLMFGAQSIGIAGGTAIVGMMMAAYGIAPAMIAAAIFVGAVLILVIGVREHPGERILPWTRGEASAVTSERHVGNWKVLVGSVWTSMIPHNSLLFLGVQLMVGSAYGIMLGVLPLVAVNEAGWTDAQFSNTAGASSLVAGLLGVLVYGVVTEKLTARIAAALGMVLFGGCGAIAAGFQPLWSSGSFNTSLIYGFYAFQVLYLVANCALAMAICSRSIGATQFTLYMATANLGMTMGSALLGPLDAIGGYTGMFAGIAVTAFTGAVLVCLVIAKAPQNAPVGAASFD